MYGLVKKSSPKSTSLNEFGVNSVYQYFFVFGGNIPKPVQSSSDSASLYSTAITYHLFAGKIALSLLIDLDTILSPYSNGSKELSLKMYSNMLRLFVFNASISSSDLQFSWLTQLENQIENFKDSRSSLALNFIF